MAESLTIVGWLWKDPASEVRYVPEHANVWARMIHRHLKMPHRFVLMTDWMDTKFDPLIEPIKLWDDWRALRCKGWPGPHCYLRLKAFSEEVRAIFGDRFVSIDLDIVVLDDLDPLFDRDEDFVIYHRPNFNAQRERNKYQGGMWMMNTGARRQVWDEFRGAESIKAASAFMGTDQAWIRHCLGPNEAGWTVKDGLLKWGNVMSDMNHDGYRREKPKGARLIFFLGGDQPDQYGLRKPPRDSQWGWWDWVAECYR